MKATGAQLLAHVLAESGIEFVAGIPGNTVLSFANAVSNEPRLVPLLVRHEATASFAADVYYRVSTKLMAVMSHALPGAVNVLAGVANAYADSSAMVVIQGEIARDALGRGAYQELSRGMDGDTAQLLRHVAKRVWQAHNPLQLVEQALRAIKLAKAGRPGPVVLTVFHDVWDQEVEIPCWPAPAGYIVENGIRPDGRDVLRAADLLGHAKCPLILAGNGVNLARAHDELLQLAELLDAPVVTTVTGKGAFPENHPLSLGVVGWFGTPCANWASREADVLLSLGSRQTEGATSSWQPGISFNFDRTRLIQADIDPAEIANVFPVDVALIGNLKNTIQDLTASAERSSGRSDWRRGVEEAKLQWEGVVKQCAAMRGSPMQVGPVVDALRRITTGQPVTVICDVGKHHFWFIQQFQALRGDIIVSSMGGGTMGIGPCGALGAAWGRPGARTIAWVGDGGMAMVPFVLPTAAEHKLPIVFIVIDDLSYSTIANLQRQRFGRTAFSEFNAAGKNPEYRLDLAAVAEACGVPSRRLNEFDSVFPALEWAFAQNGPVLLDILTDPKSMIPPSGGKKLPDIWAHPIYPWAKFGNG